MTIKEYAEVECPILGVSATVLVGEEYCCILTLEVIDMIFVGKLSVDEVVEFG